MKLHMCYFSNSGNTKLACRYLARKLESAEVDFFDVKKDKDPALGDYDIIGFATFTDYWGPSKLIQTFLEGLPQQHHKPVFVLNTYGRINGKTPKIFAEWLSEKGFDVIAGHSLHTPESFPPLVARGITFADSPDEKEIAAFDGFIRRLDDLISTIAKEGRVPASEKIRIGFTNNFLPRLPRTMAKNNMGEKHLDEALCTECGICGKGCPYCAIELDPKPVFNEEKCYGCWYCFNHCPTKAIYTGKFRGIGHYPRPNYQMKTKLGL